MKNQLQQRKGRYLFHVKWLHSNVYLPGDTFYSFSFWYCWARFSLKLSFMWVLFRRFSSHYINADQSTYSCTFISRSIKRGPLESDAIGYAWHAWRASLQVTRRSPEPWTMKTHFTKLMYSSIVHNLFLFQNFKRSCFLNVEKIELSTIHYKNSTRYKNWTFKMKKLSSKLSFFFDVYNQTLIIEFISLLFFIYCFFIILNRNSCMCACFCRF